MEKRGQAEIVGKIIFVILGVLAIVIIYSVVNKISHEVEEGIKSRDINNKINQNLECNIDRDCEEFEKCLEGKCVEMSEEGFYEDYDCNEWSECHATFSLKEIVNNNISLEGAKERDCFSTKGCLKDKTQTQTCDFKVDIYAINAFWCYENYVEIYINGTNQLVSRVKETEISEQINLSRVDINFPIQTEKEYCSFCFNKIKDFDEEGVDCGGKYCSLCQKPYSFFDWLFVLIVIMWIAIGILILYSIYLNRLKRGT